MHSNNKWLTRAKHCFVALAFLCPAPVNAQLITHFKPFRGPTMSVDGTLGVRCNSDSGSMPAIDGSAGQLGYRSSFYGTTTPDTRTMVGFVIPLKSGGYGYCRKVLAYEEAAARLQLAMLLLEAGTMTPDQYNEIAKEVHALISTAK